jgi:ribosomal protein RSM22 (predicted rRNA methylase)
MLVGRSFVLTIKTQQDRLNVKAETQSGEAKEIHELSRKLQHLLDPVVDKVFNASQLVNKTTYIQDMQNKLDTIIRKNYQRDTS